MKFTLSWLFDHLETDASLAQITQALTLIGLEVEAVEDPSAKLAAFTVAEIIDTRPHPDADRLQICKIRTQTDGQSSEMELVCGAPNARAGLKGIYAREGAVIPSNGMVLKKAKIRGVESRGMMCSEAELELSDASDGIIELPEDAEIGASAAAILGLDDPVIEIAITPNRPDCLGVRGIARDLAAFGLGTLKPDLYAEIIGSDACPISIQVEADVCPEFAGRLVRDVKNGPSPDWLVTRLRAIGLRSINALVDITNYISFDRGRPLHVYDADRLTGGVIARRGNDGESFMALDELDYKVTKADCVIADEASVLGLGGIMGGMASGCSETTKNVFIESAFFPAEQIAHSGRRHGIDSDARYRFERGVDPQSCQLGLHMATRLILDLCGGDASQINIAGSAPSGSQTIAFNPERVERLAGIKVAPAEMKTILTNLGFEVDMSEDIWQVISPSWRPDIGGAVDLVEEITRIYGLDKVPSTPLPSLSPVARPILTIKQKRTSVARRALAGRGLVEAITWSFIPEAQALAFGGSQDLRLANPISNDLSTMRPSLLPGLISAAKRNMDRGLNDFGLFEVGNIFHSLQAGDQSLSATAIRVGAQSSRDWRRAQQSGSSASDTFDARGDAQTLLQAMGVDIATLKTGRDVPAWYHPGRSGVLFRDPRTPLAFFGVLHPELLSLFDISGDVACMELFPMAVPAGKPKASKTKPRLTLSNFQSVRRDFAFEVGPNVAVEDIVRQIRSVNRELISGVHVFDVFEGGDLAQGHRSIGIEVTLQPRDATLTDADIEAVSSKILLAVEKLGEVRLRG